MDNSKLAMNGGIAVKSTPFGTGKKFGADEAKELMEALQQDTLFYHFGAKVKKFLNDFNKMYDVKYSVAASSGSAAIHVALIAAGISVGDEVITSPITDQGTIIGILYQNAVPVFADVDPNTYNMTPSSIEERITERTKAIVVVHLAGVPCEMDEIMTMAKKHKLKVIEDCAQSYMSRYKGRLVGTIGDYGCFSSNDYKHISTGDGGIVIINSGDLIDYQRVHACADKNYQRFEEVVNRSIPFLAPNYRMTELQGAVGIAQLRKLLWICEQRNKWGDQLTAGLKDLPGISVHRVPPKHWCSYWFYMFRLDLDKFTCSREQFSKALDAEGIPNTPGYIQRPIYMEPLFQNRNAYKNSYFPFELNGITYEQGICPQAEAVLDTAVRLRVSEFFTEQDLKETVAAIRKVVLYFLSTKST